MHNDEVLSHLLEIESEAAALVDDAEAEAERRITGSEKQNRAAYEERYRETSKKLAEELQKTKERAREQYQERLETYKEKVAAINGDTARFSALLNGLIEW